MNFKVSAELGAAIWARMEIPLSSWSLRLLSRDQYAMQDFAQEDGCCVDAWLGEPLRAVAPTVERLRGLDLESLFFAMARQSPSTNMSLECLLALIKSSWRGGHRKPYIETAGYLGLLTQLLQRHIEQGGENPFKDSREAMLAAGVPLARTHAETKDGSVRRVDVCWRNVKIEEWKKQNPSAAPGRVNEEHARLAKLWREMSDDQRVAAWNSVEKDLAADGGVELDYVEELREEDRDGSKWRVGSRTWPVAPEVVQDFAAGKRGGLVGNAQQTRWASRKKLLVEDQNAIPRNRTFLHRYSCWQRHPGLCFTKDHTIYNSCLAMAAAMEKYFNDGDKGFYFLVFDPANRSDGFVVYLAHVRARRPFAQQRFVFIGRSD